MAWPAFKKEVGSLNEIVLSKTIQLRLTCFTIYLNS